MNKRGSIDQIESGKFRLRMYVSGKQQTIGFYDSREEAERAADAHVVVLKDTAADFEGMTLAQLGKKILTIREVSKRVRDPGTDWSRWDMHVKPDPISRFAVKRLQSSEIAKWLRRLEAKGLAKQTRQNCLNLVRVVLSEALEDGLIKSNPAAGLRVKGKSRESWTYLTPAEQEALLFAVPDVERHIVGFAIGTGLRAGELVTLRLEDVFASENETRPRIIVRYGTAPDLPTKTGRVRTVPLFGLALAAIRPWLALLPKYCPKNPHGLVFPRVRGSFRSEEHVILWETWKAALEKAGTARRFRWHDLRHTCASSLVSGWWGRRWSLQEVKEMLGHTSIVVTQRYAHLAESALEEAARSTVGVVSASQREGGEGDPGETRTPAILFRKQVLYPAELPGPAGNDLGKRCFSRLRAGLPPPDSGLTHEASAESERRDRDDKIAAGIRRGVELARAGEREASDVNLRDVAGLLLGGAS